MEREERRAQIAALCSAEACEEFIFRVALRLRRARELSLPRSSEANDVAAAVVDVPFACEVAACLERIEQPDQHARIDAHERAELALRQRSSVVQQPEQVKLARRQIVLGVRSAQSAHGVMTDKRQQQALARRAFLEESFGDDAALALRDAHSISIPFSIVYVDQRLDPRSQQ